MGNVSRNVIERALVAIEASPIPLSASMVAHVLGVSYPTAHDALRILRDEGKIHVANRRQPMVLPSISRRAPYQPTKYYTAGPDPDPAGADEA